MFILFDAFLIEWWQCLWISVTQEYANSELPTKFFERCWEALLLAIQRWVCLQLPFSVCVRLHAVKQINVAGCCRWEWHHDLFSAITISLVPCTVEPSYFSSSRHHLSLAFANCIGGRSKPVLRKFYIESLTMAVDVGFTSTLLRQGVTAVISLCDKFSKLDGVDRGMFVWRASMGGIGDFSLLRKILDTVMSTSQIVTASKRAHSL